MPSGLTVRLPTESVPVALKVFGSTSTRPPSISSAKLSATYHDVLVLPAVVAGDEVVARADERYTGAGPLHHGAHGLGEPRAVGQVGQICLGDRVLGGDPGHRLRRVGVLQPAVRVGDLVPVQVFDDVAAPGGRIAQLLSTVRARRYPAPSPHAPADSLPQPAQRRKNSSNVEFSCRKPYASPMTYVLDLGLGDRAGRGRRQVAQPRRAAARRLPRSAGLLRRPPPAYREVVGDRLTDRLGRAGRRTPADDQRAVEHRLRRPGAARSNGRRSRRRCATRSPRRTSRSAPTSRSRSGPRRRPRTWRARASPASRTPTSTWSARTRCSRPSGAAGPRCGPTGRSATGPANGIDPAGVALAVVVQRMVDAVAAGVMFTADPVTGTRHQAVIDASPGLGEAVVSGAVNPDHFVVDTATGRDRSSAGSATSGRRSAVGRRRHRAGRTARRQRAGLPDRRAGAGAGRARAPGRTHYGAPQDTEWALDGDGKLWLTQARPITTLYPLPDGRTATGPGCSSASAWPRA